MSVRAIRGAIQVEGNSIGEIHEGVKELLGTLMQVNTLVPDNVISVILTSTPDLTADFPAVGARGMGFESVPLLCATEIDVPGALPRVIRVMLHCETELSQKEVTHVYLKGAAALRRDLAQ